MRINFLVAMLLMSALLLSSPLTASAAPKYNWRMAIEEVPGSVQDIYAQEFSKRLAKASGGDIKLNIYPIGTLGTARDVFEMVQDGTIAFGILSPGNTGGFVPENQIFSMQFFFSDNMDVNKAVCQKSKALDILKGIYNKKGVKVLSFWPEGFQIWTSNRKLEKPEDFNGMKMRVMPSPMLIAGYEAYGANPTPLPFMEVYSGLQLKIIDGQENPLFAIEEMHFMDVQKYLTMSKHGVFFTSTSMSADLFDSLPADVRTLIEETILGMQDFAFEAQAKLNATRLEKMKKETKNKFEIVELSSEARAQFRKASAEVLNTYYKLCNESEASKKIGPMLAEEIRAMEEKIGN